jgi:hypothetical protein
MKYLGLQPAFSRFKSYHISYNCHDIHVCTTARGLPYILYHSWFVLYRTISYRIVSYILNALLRGVCRMYCRPIVSLVVRIVSY